ncbi:MAG: type IV pilin protein [Candidatus Nitrospinota bacterium M3_3B_026]
MKNREGFTLVELLIVVAIIGILAAIAIPQFAAYREKAYCSSIESDLANFAIAEEAYYTDHDIYASATVDLTGFSSTSGVALTINTATTDSFTATATHANCDQDDDGSADVYTWDSTAGGLQ